jgi:hypothetical protein
MGSGMSRTVHCRVISVVFGIISFMFPTLVFSDCPAADLSGNCIVDTEDLLLFAEDWLSMDLPQHNGLVAYWALNESEGETATDIISGYTGFLHGNPQWMPAEGAIQGGLFLDGTDDYIEVTGYKGITGRTARTCAAWVKTSSSSDNPIISWGSSVAGQKWMFRVMDSKLGVGVWNGYIQSQQSVNDGQWHHLVAVLPDIETPVIGQVLLYIDGILDSQPYISSTQAINTVESDVVLLGARIGGSATNSYFLGMIDEVQIYNSSLTDEEVMLLYQRGTAVHHNPDYTSDNQVNVQDLKQISQQWLHEEPIVIISEFLASNDASNPPDASQGQIRDGNGDSSDWIELYNQSDLTVDLGGWGLTDNPSNSLKWKFPAGTFLEGRSRLVVFASSKEQKDYPNNYPYIDPLGYLHTNFKLSAEGEYLALSRPNGMVEHEYNSVLNPDTLVYGFPVQKENISYGMLNNEKYYFALPTPAGANRESFLGFVGAPQFSHERGFYDASFSLTLTTETPDAVIRYTTNGTDPTLANGITYTSPIAINTSTSPVGRYIRAAAFKPGYEPSPIKTRTFLMNASSAMKGLPAICLSGSQTDVFYNPNGIMAIVGGTWSGGVWQKLSPTDYNNVLGQGMDYERPVSLEYIRYLDGTEFQEDCGIRVHGSAWMRPRYTLASVSGSWSGTNKYSMRLYFRSRYGESKLRHSILEKFPEVEEMDTFVLRAGHNDQTNPFIRDEMIRRLQYRTGHQASRGTFVNLFINGSYKGFYNLCERLDEGYFQQWYDSSYEWDVLGWVQPDNVLEARDGDMTAFNEFINYAQTHNLTNPLYYAEVERQMDMTEFVDYIIVQCWSGNWDWPQNNWTAASERSTNRKWRFFVWDGEGGMDGTLDQNRFNKLVSSDSDRSHLSRLYKSLKDNEDFKILFADRLQKHFLNADGAMTKENMTALFWELAAEVQSVIPSISTYIPYTFIPSRESIFFSQCVSQGLFAYAAPRIYLNGQEAKKEHALENSLLSLQNASGVSGDVYYTLDGTDPRLPLLSRNTTKTLVAENASKRVLVPTSNIGTQWRTQINYNDTSWNDGLPMDSSKTGGVGYEINTTETTSNVPYISYNLVSKMYNQYNSAYIRIPFTVNGDEIQNWNYLTLKMRYDDGFIAYINGVEVCRSGFSGTPSWNSAASTGHENSSLVVFTISDYLYTLQGGNNVLAIQGLNQSASSSDFIISAILETGNVSNSQGISPSAQKYTSPVALTKSAHIKARTLNGSQWGALQEAFISIGSLNENLRISEFLYHPNGDPNEEFVELKNIGATPLNLNKVSFTKGIQYTFADTVLQPGQYLLLVQNKEIFENRYGTGLPIAGQFEGALNNAGEKLEVNDITGTPIQTVDYSDGWYEIADGDGFSLTAIDPAYEKTRDTMNPEAHWRFNESAGAAVYDAIGLHHGTIYNMQNTSRVYGHEDKALLFDGVDDYIEVAGYKGISGGASRTCTAWIKTSGSQDSPILSWGSPIAGQKWMFRVSQTGNLAVGVWDGYIQSQQTINDGQWHYVVAVLLNDGSPELGEIKLYIDGDLQTNPYISNPREINTSNAENVFLGARIGGSTTNSYFSGIMDDVRIYNRALTQNEISSQFSFSWSSKGLWRPSAIRGGTPGRDETSQESLPLPESIVINEILAHSHGELADWIELYNTTGQDINIGGWFLSDSFNSDSERKKYRIPDGVILTPANPYYVIEENLFNNLSNPACRIPFALSEGGETLYLQSAQGEQLTGYFTKEEFGATETGVSLGRFEKSTGGWNFVPMSVQTKGEANAYPKVGPIIISEIMYNPGTNAGDQDYEYIELMNISNTAVRTASFVSTYSSPTSHIEEWVPWKFTEGIEFEFPVNLSIAAGQRILLVKKRTSFDARYTGIPAGTVIYEWTSGNLANEGETLQISMAGDQEYLQKRYYIREDRVNYDDELPWPPQADGTGQSLTHLRPTEAGNNYTNDPIHWTAATATPGW